MGRPRTWLAIAATLLTVGCGGAAHKGSAPPTSGSTVLSCPGGIPKSLDTASSIPLAPGSPPELALAAQHPDLATIKPAPIRPNGAIGFNSSGWHSIAEQRRISPTLLFGLVCQDPGTVSMAITAMEYSFAHQNGDGSFQVVQFPGQHDLATFDPVGDAFFYADLAHCLTLLSESHWFQTSAIAAPLRARVDALRPTIALGLSWLLGPSELAALHQTGLSGTNRWTFAANALILTGQWAGNQEAIAQGLTIIQLVLHAQQADGTLPELQRFDSSYQGVSLNNLAVLYLHLGTEAASVKPAIGQALQRGVSRETQAVLPDGDIVTTGNSRVFCGGEQFHGKPKGGEYRDVVIAFTYESELSADSSLLILAQTVANHYRGTRGGPAACPS